MNGETASGGAEGPPQVPDHELLRCIGCGSYGDVWLARSATGIYRAVKILRRSRFGDDPHPFEREFDGLQRFEPLSREHEHLVDVLHIGRQDDLLYYVMELADDAGRPGARGSDLDPQSYQPDTLSARLRRVGSLPVTDCIDIGRALGRALEHLHDRDLIHRDVKPSNVLFVGGVLKLADVGLVSAPDATLSLVGTEGFIPPEGPGTAGADLYATGKILYEASTGLDRMEFPSAPAHVFSGPAGRDWGEFNEVILKCCAADRAERYGSARAFLDDLDWLGGGKSLVKRRQSRRLWRSLRRSAAAASLAAGLVALGFAVAPRGEREDRLPWDASSAFMPDLSAVSFPAIRYRHRPYDFTPDGVLLAIENGGDVVVWNRLDESIRPVLTGDDQDGWHLSNPRWLDTGHDLVCLGFRHGEEAVLRVDPNQGEITEVVFRTKGFMRRLACCPRTRTLAVRVSGPEDGAGPEGLLGIRLESGEVEVWDPDGGYGVGDFSPDGRWLGLWSQRTGPHDQGVFESLALSTESGETHDLTAVGGFAAHTTWSVDGSQVYFVAGASHADDATLDLFGLEVDPTTALPVGEPRKLTGFPNSQVMFPQVIAGTGELALLRVNEGIAIWAGTAGDPSGGRRLAIGSKPLLSSRGKWVFYVGRDEGREGIYRVSADGNGPAERLVPTIPLDFDVSPAGRSLVVAEASAGGVEIIATDVEGGGRSHLAQIGPGRGTSVRYSHDGGSIAYTDGPDLWVMASDGTGRRKLGSIYDWDENVWAGKLAWAPDDTKIAGFGYPDAASREADNNHLFVADLAEGTLVSVAGSGPDASLKEGLDWHPDSTRLAFMLYHPGYRRSEIRQASAHGGPTERLVDEGGERWEWIAKWHPGGQDLWFLSYSNEPSSSNVRILSTVDGSITTPEPPLDDLLLLPEWSGERHTVMWGVGSATKHLLILSPN